MREMVSLSRLKALHSIFDLSPWSVVNTLNSSISKIISPNHSGHYQNGTDLPSALRVCSGPPETPVVPKRLSSLL